MAFVLLSAVAHAQPKDATARADALFEKGKSELAANRPKQACAAFEESYSLDAAEGTLLALGLCHEQLGDLPRAWNELSRVQTSSSREDRQRVAKSALARIEPKVGRITLRPPTDPECATSLAVDDVKVTTTTAVTPGSHRVTCDRWNAAVDVAPGDAQVVTVPEKATEKPIAPPLALKPVPPPPETAPFPWGYVVGGAGVAALGIGTIFGVSAFHQWSDVKAKCNPAACTDRSADTDASAAKRAALIADIAVPIGAVLIAAGIYLVVTRSSSHAP